MVDITEADEIDFRYNLGKYWQYVKRYKAYFAVIVGAGFIGPVAAVSERFIFKELVDEAERFAAGTLPQSGFVNILLFLAALFLGLTVVKAVSDWVKIHFLVRFESAAIQDMKNWFFNHILNLSHRFYTGHKTGALVARLNRGANALQQITNFLTFNVLSLLFNLTLVVGSLLFFDVYSAAILFLTAAAYIGYSLYVLDVQKESSIAYNNAEDREKANLSDIFTNIASIKYYAAESRINTFYQELTSDTKDKEIWYGDYFRALDTGQHLILKLGITILLAFPLLRFMQGAMTLGGVVFVYTSFGILNGPLFGFVHGVRRFYRSMAHFESLYQYAELENEIKDDPGAKPLTVENGRITFDNVSFSYDEETVIQDFNLEVAPGEKIALVGHSGAGKSTIIKLLYRLYDVDEGSIRVDGQNVEDVTKHSLRSALSIVPQECILFDDTIYNNIKFANPDATDDAVWDAIRFAQLDEFIQDLPDQEETVVGERGIKLSTGEKQRVSIARALLADRDILVLDEATSALDSKTEQDIQDDLRKLLEGRTAIMIAHRLSTIMNADRIIVMDDGAIVQQGSHEELIDDEDGIYHELWQLQKGGYIGE